jgi:hypothetical protein
MTDNKDHNDVETWLDNLDPADITWMARRGSSEYEDLEPMPAEQAEATRVRLFAELGLDPASPTRTVTPPNPPAEDPHHEPSDPPPPHASASGNAATDFPDSEH